MANKFQMWCITCWISILCAIVIGFGSAEGASGLRKIRGIVRVGTQPIRGAEVTVIDAKEASARYESCLTVAKSNVAVLSDKLRNLSDRQESIEKDRTAKIYKTMFSETGPADKEQLRQEINALNLDLTRLKAEEASLRGMILTRRSSEPFLEGRWTNVIAVARTTSDGEFLIRIPPARNCWLAISCKTNNSPDPAHGWLLPVPSGNIPLTLCETNAISSGF